MVCTDEWMSLSEAARRLPKLDGRKIHPSSLWRWCKQGIRGQRMRYRKLGGRIVLTLADIDEFSQRLAEADDLPRGPKLTDAPKPRTDNCRQRDIARAEADLERAGI